MADSRWPFGRRRIADLTTVVSAMTLEESQDIAGVYGHASPGPRDARQAIVASPRWDLARAFERGSDQDGMTTIVFASLPVACTWLMADFDQVNATIDELRRTLRSE